MEFTLFSLRVTFFHWRDNPATFYRNYEKVAVVIFKGYGVRILK